MTTIVWKRPGILACDKMCSAGGIRYRGKSKMQRRDRYVYAVAGTLASGLKIIEWIEHGAVGECPTDDDQVEVVQMDLTTGKCWTWCKEGVPIPVEDKLYAVGSGRELALGAMAMGASPEEAVRAAAAWDDGTGFGVQVVLSERAQRVKEEA